MASKILHAGDDIGARPIQWCEVGRPSQPHQPHSGTEAVAKPAEDGEARAALEARHQAELARIRTEALKQGEAAGRKQATAELDTQMRRLAQTIEEVAGTKTRLQREAERDIVWLSLAIARRVLRRELQIDEEAILGLIKAALENASLREITEVRTHPSHLTSVAEHLRRIGAPEAIKVRADATLELGGIVIETTRGTLDASLETQLEEIGRGMADIVEQSRRRQS